MMRNKNLIQFLVNFEELHSMSSWHQLMQLKIASLTAQQVDFGAKATQLGPQLQNINRGNDVQRVYPSRLSSKLQITEMHLLSLPRKEPW